jgi:hypothetical protein
MAHKAKLDVVICRLHHIPALAHRPDNLLLVQRNIADIILNDPARFGDQPLARACETAFGGLCCEVCVSLEKGRLCFTNVSKRELCLKNLIVDSWRNGKHRLYYFHHDQHVPKNNEQCRRI